MERTNNKNFVIFLVLTFLLLIGWMQLDQWLRPPKPKEPADKPDAAQVDPKPKEQPKDPRPETESPAAQIVRAAEEVSRVAGRAVRPPSLSQDIFLGDGSFFLKAKLDLRGASVRSVWLNKFQQVDRLGKPEWLEVDGKRVPKPLELVREDLNRESGSYLLLHLDPNRKGHDPLPTLGEIEWEVVELQKVETGQVYRKVAFATEIDGVRITKTFTLEPDDYHIGLEVKLERLADAPGGAKPFPYQITSSHGVRIEGEWYTSVLRNNLIGWKDTRRDVFLRTLEEARSVSFRLGGDPVEVHEGDKLIRYAGVVVQYFASLLVVDDRQENQGIGILARARASSKARR